VRFATRWLLLVLGGGLVLVLVRGWRPGRRLPPASRTYLGLRRAYAKAGWTAEDDGAGPLAFAEALEREQAPGADDAAAAVDLYLRARFGGEEATAELARRAQAAKAKIRPRAKAR
jgi:hypothetical protein